MSKRTLIPDVKTKENDKKTVKVFVSVNAWIKMHALVKEFSTEVQWHGTVTRISKNEFLIEDILLFPHEVSRGFVTSDQTEYEAWLQGLDDKTFNKCRFHGHSHVEMRARPSSIDDKYRNDILNNFCAPTPEDDYFYIFLILNKFGDAHCLVYDLKNKVNYGFEEVRLIIKFNDETNLEAFIAEAKKLATETTNRAILEKQNKNGAEHTAEHTGELYELN